MAHCSLLLQFLHARPQLLNLFLPPHVGVHRALHPGVGLCDLCGGRLPASFHFLPGGLHLVVGGSPYALGLRRGDPQLLFLEGNGRFALRNGLSPPQDDGTRPSSSNGTENRVKPCRINGRRLSVSRCGVIDLGA